MTTLPALVQVDSQSRQDPEWLEAYWMLFTTNRSNFKADPRIVVGWKGSYYADIDGRSKCSAHPVACAVALASLDVLVE